jgi:sugar/nucleoside kinase (ribokinase family)
MGTAVIDHLLEVAQLPDRNGTAVVTSEAVMFGGRGAGPAATYGALGGRPVLLSAVGKDFTSSGFEEFLQVSGVDLRFVAREYGDNCYSTNTYIEAASRDAFTFFQPRELGHTVSPDDITAVSSAEMLYIAGYNSHDALFRVSQAAISGGVPVALGLCNGIVPYVSDSLLRALIGSASLIAFNDDEWEIARERMQLLSETGLFELAPSLECIYHTRGPSVGRAYLRDGSEFQIPVRPVEKCVSTIGAGDTFMAGVLYGRFLGLDYVASATAGSLLASFNVETTLGATFLPTETSRLADRLIESLRASGINV